MLIYSRSTQDQCIFNCKYHFRGQLGQIGANGANGAGQGIRWVFVSIMLKLRTGVHQREGLIGTSRLVHGKLEARGHGV